MKRIKVLAITAVLAATIAAVVAISLPTNAAPIPVGKPDCSIVLCPAPPPTCPPGYKLGIPAGQCCFACVRSR